MILSFYFSFISFPCSWIILCFSLIFFIARVDSASDSFSLFSISACKFFCSGPPQCSSCIHQQNSKRIWLTLFSSSSFSFLSSFFVVFVVFIPRADRGVVYMRVLEKLGGFGGFVATGLGRSEHMRRRWFRHLWGEDSTVSWWHPGICVRICHVTKNALGSRRRRIEQMKISPLLLHVLVMPPCSDRPIKCSLSGGETA